MVPPPLPLDERRRLQVLCELGLLDTPPEERFDRIVRTAARLFRVPVALVSLVDAERQWFKAKHGLEALQTPRDVSFCGHAILNAEPLVVLDAKADERFADNPLVTGAPFVRFYAGQPVRGPEGQRVGTLCLIDHVPRRFSEEDRRCLADLAAWVELELNLGALREAHEALTSTGPAK
ncbi:GAF domain-containing protein [Archangium sp.]|uniref:GAF domain-containing protein n=1 Tax=Archangium sp. TaxID=1872627 RepID=UPI00286C4EAB|nr:GAF domain-containing protein [Archangium sp.]